MPSDAKKQRALAKKQAANQRTKPAQQKAAAAAPTTTNNDDADNTAVNGHVNGDAAPAAAEKKMLAELERLDLSSSVVAQHRTTASVLSSNLQSRDLHWHSISMRFHGKELLVDSHLELNWGRRYGLVGQNGSGKSSLMAALQCGELARPSHIDSFLLQREAAPSNKTALETVLDVEEERKRLEAEANQLTEMTCNHGGGGGGGGGVSEEELTDRLTEVWERLEALEAGGKSEARAARILTGLGFNSAMQQRRMCDFSGGWRMRVGLARALFVRPALLLLDEPTNHLDLGACVWLEKELARYHGILVVTSHSQDFLDGVCTNTLLLRNQRLTMFGGNYSTYVRVRAEQEECQAKRYEWEQREIAHMKDYVARFGHGSKKLARQAQSKEKTLQKMVSSGLTERVTGDKVLSFFLPDPGTYLAPPILQVQAVSFAYPGATEEKLIYSGIDFGLDLETRLALVGPNGAGKSTLLKLLAGELDPTDGMIRRHSHLRIGRFHQHLADMLRLDRSALEWMLEEFGNGGRLTVRGGCANAARCAPGSGGSDDEQNGEESSTAGAVANGNAASAAAAAAIINPVTTNINAAGVQRDEMRRVLGRFGVTGTQQVCPISTLSDGQRVRVVFAWLAQQAPHMLLLDEPTNHLDMDSIDALADAINEFNGGLVLVSHDFRLIQQVAKEIWLCQDRTVTPWKGDIFSYKAHLAKMVDKI